ncbi:SMI1/KNR4 family protein [Leptospira kanakyensis]|uniref:SMI1/KNR4 family protein n=1 Tax=Leptospira kanakyensis TaxID=2484968 RepID=A0A6N4Q5G4_9LEPT|nr:SMI1/KNR4 family protein [Leptospira kanakyensis]MCW7471830.1 SMI1/KNR4 family protein [Leptospira kanakyensis]TGK55738.1 SMI1/KNR4 family protein [Leptospira kanakyensis]TGK65311.1 SMI1/KNR4 family protein [Leptospira kanakyensis]
MKLFFKNVDFDNFWEDSEYANENYVSETLTLDNIEEAELTLGYKLPKSYIHLMKNQNGGIPKNTCFPTQEKNGYADGYIQISGIYGIGKSKNYSLLGELGSRFMIEEWEYPDIGIMICNTPSAGHEMIMLDYSESQNNSEPKVVYIDQEADFRKITLANNFETFIEGLLPEENFDTSEEDLRKDREKILNGDFSSILQKLVNENQDFDFERIIRKLALDKSFVSSTFAFHSDEISHFIYDILFLLYTRKYKVKDIEDFTKIYETVIAFSDGEFSTQGYAPDFIIGWMKEKIQKKEMNKRFLSGYKFNINYQNKLINKIKLI